MAGADEILSQIAQAEDYKKKGNDRFKEGDFKKALGSYHRVFCMVNGLAFPGEESQASQTAAMMGKRSGSQAQVPDDKVQDVKKLKSSTHLNMAACYLKTGQQEKCIDSCTKVLQLEENPKAYFRRGQARLELRQIYEAKEDLVKANKLNPEDAAIKQEIKKLQRALAEAHEKEKKSFAGMFDRKAKKQTAEKAEEVEAGAEGESGDAKAPYTPPADPAEAAREDKP